VGEIVIVREGLVDAPADVVWSYVAEVDRIAEWFSFADRMEVIEGEGLGRRQRLYGHWGKRRSEVDQQIIQFDPPRSLAWRHLAERLDGKPAPRFARSAEFRILLDPQQDATRVRLESRQEPASVLKGLMMRLFGTRQVAQNVQRSLDRLAAVVLAHR
jgi:uncharacterized membrane protein